MVMRSFADGRAQFEVQASASLDPAAISAKLEKSSEVPLRVTETTSQHIRVVLGQ
jgi:hypothetical protein